MRKIDSKITSLQKYLPDFNEVTFNPLPTSYISYHNMQSSRFSLRRFIKRFFDVLFSLMCLLFGLPVYLLIALGIFFTSPGPIFYAHKRLGRQGKPFVCYKFRTMYQNADVKLQQILESSPQLKKEWEENFKLKNDPRITSFGRFLRKTSLDELPQFWNVLKGDLSVVGPRPVVQEEILKYFGSKAQKILSMRPGLTGVWQTSGRSDVFCYQERIALDEYYIDHSSFLFDLQLILKTIPSIIRTKGAY